MIVDAIRLHVLKQIEGTSLQQNPYDAPRETADELPRISTVRRFAVFSTTLFVWAALAGLASTKLLSLGHSVDVMIAFWVSPLAGPFAFAEHFLFLQNPLGSALMAFTVGCFMFAHPIRPSSTTAVLTVIGVSFWCIIGFSITYIGV